MKEEKATPLRLRMSEDMRILGMGENAHRLTKGGGGHSLVHKRVADRQQRRAIQITTRGQPRSRQ